MAVQRLLVVGVRVTEQFAEPRDVVDGRGDQPIKVVMADLVAEVSQQGAIRLVHLDPQLLTVHVVAFGEIDGDDTIFVPGHHLLVRAGQQPESQPVVGVLIMTDDRQLQLVQLGHQSAFGRFGPGELHQAGGVGVVGTLGRQRARHAQQAGTIDRNQPIAFGQMAIGAQFVGGGADEAGTVGVLTGSEHQQRHLVEGEPERAAAVQTRRVLECQPLAAVGAMEVTHTVRHLRRAQHRPRRRSRFSWSWCR